MTIQEINNFLSSPELNNFLMPFKVLFITISVLFLIMIIYYGIKQFYFIAEKRRMLTDFINPFFGQSAYILSRWRGIVKSLRAKDDINYKLAIINLEGMLYDIFKALKYNGASLAEMLPEIKEKKSFQNPEALESLVYLAGKIKTDPTYKFDPIIVEKIASEVSDFLVRLKIID
ncbi:MAG TPA: hypothetical protein PL093_00225 [Candidatus Pacearchaeota archaeon]|jgi:hypothetical protein|nr:hypothetical protein [Candidatus Pacearchaeota archaeon]HRR94570.1 hypothetical protein [Candidatus Paceibacterota bacterium]HPC30435.1 hypothetical protein [Candidatus Pacearchaeota archaeon]HQG09387.1 hypothetical protein [Candidatus Pacearchaeota archaeon]HQH19990.1 hypothetical protein [Candidatus Pacearchaeota archaeon]